MSYIFKRTVLILCILIILGAFTACSDSKRVAYDRQFFDLTLDNVEDYLEIITQASDVKNSKATEYYEYKFSVAPKQSFLQTIENKMSDVRFFNCQITLKLTVNERSQTVEVKLNEKGEALNPRCEFAELQPAYTFKTSYEIVSASGTILDGVKTNYHKNGFFADTDAHAYITWFGENRGAAIEYSTLVDAWTLRYINPREVFYISDCVFTPSGYPILYEGAYFFSGNTDGSTDKVEVLIFDGVFDASQSRSGYFLNGYDLRSGFPNLKCVYIREIINDEWMREKGSLSLPESGVTFYIDDTAEGFRSLLERSYFVTGVYSTDKMDITPYQ